MSTDAAAGHTPFTSVTWADLPIGLDPAHAPTGWEARVDLAYELAPHLPHLPIAQVRLLVESAASGLPVVLTWDTYLNRDLKSIERTRTTVVVAALYGPRGAHYVGEARIRYSGFGHSVQFRQIVSVDEVECTRTYRDLPLPEAQ